MIEKIDHIGIAVTSLSTAIPFYENVLGLTCEKIEEVPSQKVKTAFFKLGDIHLELLEPTSEESPIHKFIEKKGPGFHHIAYQSGAIQEDLSQAEGEGIQLINATPVPGAGGKQVAFLHPKSTGGMLTEFCSDNA